MKRIPELWELIALFESEPTFVYIDMVQLCSICPVVSERLKDIYGEEFGEYKKNILRTGFSWLEGKRIKVI